MARRDDLAIVAAAIADQLGDPAPECRQRIQTALEALGVERIVALLMQALAETATGDEQVRRFSPARRFFQRIGQASEAMLG